MLLGSTIAARSAGRKGLLYGTATSISFFLLTLVFGLAMDHSLFNLVLVFKKLSLTVVSGILGGIIGVGMNS
jgi:putative membrane protein (TIGR04086 family)